ncbi:MAG: GNAT family N-acetyltransferase [Deferribacterota bacterium]|nr:GNAT family N-acetyltransferase [Deferribacterota bacterium]
MTKVFLRDGSVVQLRKINNNKRDREQLKELFNKASKESLYHRFFIPVKEIRDDLIDNMVQTDEKKGLSLICEINNQIVAVGTYIKTDGEGTAEVSFFVDDKLQGLGIGSILLTQLAYIAWINGFTRFIAYVMPENKKMIYVFKNSGFEVSQKWESGELYLTLPLYETERVNSIKEMREKYATAASLIPFFRPLSILLLEDTNNKYPNIYKNISNSGYNGKIVRDIKDLNNYSNLDLAIFNMSTKKALDIIKSLKVKIKCLLIMGFYHNIDLKTYKNIDSQLINIVKNAGSRIIGPYSLGIINNKTKYMLNASFMENKPHLGTLSIASHSGALGLYLVEHLDSIGIGIKNFVSLGNKIDVSSNDLIQFWEDDMDTEVIILYLESFGNPEKFTHLSRRISRIKPIIVVKSAKNPISATISKQKKVELALDDYTVNNLFKQAGIIRVETIEELFDTVKVFYSNKIPENDNIAIISNTPEASIVLTDALNEKGLINIKDTTLLNLNEEIEEYINKINKLLNKKDIDIIILIYTPLFKNNSKELINSLTNSLSNNSKAKLIMVCMLNSKDIPELISINNTTKKIPLFSSPEKIAKSLGHVIYYSNYIKRPKGNVPDIEGFNPREVREYLNNIIQSRSNNSEILALNDKELKKFLLLMGLVDSKTIENNILAYINLFLLRDPYYGPLLGIERTWIDDSFEGLDKFTHRDKNISLIRLTPLTNIEAEDIMNSLLQGHEFEKNLKDKLKIILLKFARLPREIPEINKVMVRNAHLYVNDIKIEDIKVNIAKPKIEL